MSDNEDVEVPAVIEIVKQSPMKTVRNKSNKKILKVKPRAEMTKAELHQIERDAEDRKCKKGDKHCRACSKGISHSNPPAYITCLYCGSIHGFYRIRTGRLRREKIYAEDRDGNQVPYYNADGDFAGFCWRWGDIMYYDDGTPMPETKFAMACSSDACKLFKIPIAEVERWNERTHGKLEKV